MPSEPGDLVGVRQVELRAAQQGEGQVELGCHLAHEDEVRPEALEQPANLTPRDGARGQALRTSRIHDANEHLGASGVDQRDAVARAFGRRCAGHGVQRWDTHDGAIQPHSQAFCERYSDPKAHEGAGPDPDRHSIQAGSRPPRGREQLGDERQHELRVRARLAMFCRGYELFPFAKGDGAAGRRSFDTKDAQGGLESGIR